MQLRVVRVCSSAYKCACMRVCVSVCTLNACKPMLFVISVHVSMCLVLFLTLQARSAVSWVENDHFDIVQLHELLVMCGAMIVIKHCVCGCGCVGGWVCAWVCGCGCMGVWVCGCGCGCVHTCV